MASPHIWGPTFWKVIHNVAYFYPPEPNATQMKSAFDFYTSLKDLLPCAVCREHFAQHLLSHPLHDAVLSRSNLITWTVDVHNAVNISTGKPALAFNEAMASIEKQSLAFDDEVTQSRHLLTLSVVIIFIISISCVAGIRVRSNRHVCNDKK